jgi:hypothetical protein
LLLCIKTKKIERRLIQMRKKLIKILSSNYLTSTIARDLKGLEAISFGIGRSFDYAFHHRIKVADCFARACTDSVEVLATTNQGNHVARRLQGIHRIKNSESHPFEDCMANTTGLG